MTDRHFHIPAREMLLDSVEVCPFYGALTFEGLAVEEVPGAPDRVYLIVSTGTTRAYLGPDRRTVARRALILTMALMSHPQALPADRASDVLDWLSAAWDASTDTIRELVYKRDAETWCGLCEPIGPLALRADHDDCIELAIHEWSETHP